MESKEDIQSAAAKMLASYEHQRGGDGFSIAEVFESPG